MSCSLSFHIPKALPSLSPPSHRCTNRLLSVVSCHKKQSHHTKQHPQLPTKNKFEDCTTHILNLTIQVGGVLATVAQPALAETGVNDEEDLVWVLIQLGIAAFFYFLFVPPFILNWLRTRWYKRNLLEMYLQFMFVFMFFPGVLIWAPFLNVRKLPRDPSMKYPWSVPENPSQVKGGFLKYPWAQAEDYE